MNSLPVFIFYIAFKTSAQKITETLTTYKYVSSFYVPVTFNEKSNLRLEKSQVFTAALLAVLAALDSSSAFLLFLAATLLGQFITAHSTSSLRQSAALLCQCRKLSFEDIGAVKAHLPQQLSNLLEWCPYVLCDLLGIAASTELPDLMN